MKRTIPAPVALTPQVYQALYEVRADYYETTHHVPDAPWMEHTTVRHDAPPLHLEALRAREERTHTHHHVTDGASTLLLTPRVTCLRVTESAPGHWAAQVHVAWYRPDGTHTHAICYTSPLHADIRDAHIEHLDAFHAQIPVSLG